jgi:hypothetical protein
MLRLLTVAAAWPAAREDVQRQLGLAHAVDASCTCGSHTASRCSYGVRRRSLLPVLSLFSSSGNAAACVKRRSHSAAGLKYVCAYQRRVPTPLRMCLLSEHGPLCAAARLSLHVCLAGPWACSALQCVVGCCVWQHLALFWGLLATMVSRQCTFSAPA